MKEPEISKNEKEPLLEKKQASEKKSEAENKKTIIFSYAKNTL